jgi:pantoate--beta-alanine ligase
MIIIEDIASLRSWLDEKKARGNTIGFVPTMGFLHEGHLSLVKEAKAQSDIVVVSIFVNPSQFGPGEDLDAYPRDLEGDQEKLKSQGVDVLFYPSVKVMYPDGFNTNVTVEGSITTALCGRSRPTHFKGVTTVVNKLFNMVSPHKAFFGQKDAQQVAVIQKMVRDLNMNIEVVPCPIQREPDGLAMSSRNAYLTETQRKDALVLHESLKLAKEMIDKGERKSIKIIESMVDKINSVDYAIIDYIEIVNPYTLEALDFIEGEVLIALAVKIGKPRLIDNMKLEVSSCY